MRAIGNPAVMRELTRVGMQSRTLMEWVLRIMANLLRPDELGPAEAAYRAVGRARAPRPRSRDIEFGRAGSDSLRIVPVRGAQRCAGEHRVGT